jgi:hypothetical protein
LALAPGHSFLFEVAVPRPGPEAEAAADTELALGGSASAPYVPFGAARRSRASRDPQACLRHLFFVFTVTDLGPWRPLDLGQAASLLDEVSARWWVSGGHALELHLQTAWRKHADVDVDVRRCDVRALAALPEPWELWVAADGRLRRWEGGDLVPERHEDALWCRPGPSAAWALDIKMSEGDDEAWIYRCDPRIRVSWDEAVLVSRGGLPYLAPELQLLFKSLHPRPKDDIDAANVIPCLTPVERARLSGWLPQHHPWIRYLQA